MHNFLKKFIKANQGSVAPIFAGAIIPILFIVGASVDYTTQIKNTSYVSNVADAALLSVSDDVEGLVSTVTTNQALETKVKALLDPLLTTSLAKHADVSYQINNVEYSKVSKQLKVDIEVTQDTTFIKLAKVDEIKSIVTTGITMGDEVVKEAVSIAFVVDKSGSMDNDWKHLKASIKAMKVKLNKLDPNAKFIRTGLVLYDHEKFGFFGMHWGMQKTWKEFKKDEYIPVAGRLTNSSGAIIDAYDKLRTQAENKAHAKKNNSHLRKVVVFFSDGANNNSEDTVSTAATCEDIKAAGIEIYSIKFGLKTDPPAEKMMSDCASDTAHYYRTKSAKSLKDAFAAIGETVTQEDLYLSY